LKKKNLLGIITGVDTLKETGVETEGKRKDMEEPKGNYYGGSESKSRRRHDAGRISATATAGIAGIGFLSWASVHDA